MMAIIAHHSVVNSTVLEYVDFRSPCFSTYFMMLWGMWGKTAINSFVLISGYFLCKGNFTWQRWVKLLAEMYFYGIAIMCIFAVCGYESLTAKNIVQHLVWPLRGVNNGFGASFMAFYMFVPIYNALLGSLDRKSHGVMVLGLLIYFTVASTFFGGKSMNEPFWYMTLFFVVAYIRCYEPRWSKSHRAAVFCLLVSMLISVSFVVTVLYIVSDTNTARFGILELISEKIAAHPVVISYWLVSDSNKLFAFMVGLSAFLVAKNAPKFHSKWVNFMAAGTFAVLLIHASSDTMRRWLWQDMLDIPSYLGMTGWGMVLRLMVIPVVAFVVCSLIDVPRRRWIEKPMMRWLNMVNFEKCVRFINKWLKYDCNR